MESWWEESEDGILIRWRFFHPISDSQCLHQEIRRTVRTILIMIVCCKAKGVATSQSPKLRQILRLILDSPLALLPSLSCHVCNLKTVIETLYAICALVTVALERSDVDPLSFLRNAGVGRFPQLMVLC